MILKVYVGFSVKMEMTLKLSIFFQYVRRITSLFVIENFAKPPTKNYVTNKTDVHCIDDNWSMDLFNLKLWAEEQ